MLLFTSKVLGSCLAVKTFVPVNVICMSERNPQHNPVCLASGLTEFDRRTDGQSDGRAEAQKPG